jgi:MYXO-CTERM domain-containing protein
LVVNSHSANPNKYSVQGAFLPVDDPKAPQATHKGVVVYYDVTPNKSGSNTKGRLMGYIIPGTVDPTNGFMALSPPVPFNDGTIPGVYQAGQTTDITHFVPVKVQPAKGYFGLMSLDINDSAGASSILNVMNLNASNQPQGVCQIPIGSSSGGGFTANLTGQNPWQQGRLWSQMNSIFNPATQKNELVVISHAHNHPFYNPTTKQYAKLAAEHVSVNLDELIQCANGTAGPGANPNQPQGPDQPPGTTGGCGCRSADTGSSALGALGLFGIMLFATRRRRRA